MSERKCSFNRRDLTKIENFVTLDELILSNMYIDYLDNGPRWFVYVTILNIDNIPCVHCEVIAQL